MHTSKRRNRRDTFTVNDIAYEVTVVGTPNKVTTTGYTGSATSVSITDAVTNSGISYNVTEIGFEAFKQKGLTSVVIGDNVLAIEDLAFELNADLVSVTLEDNLETIGFAAFNKGAIRV